MATYDLTSRATAFINADSIAAYPTSYASQGVRTVEAFFDLKALIKNGYTLSTGDVFQVLEIPANTLILTAGVEVVEAFDGTAAVDVDFAGGDDIVDGADVTSVGICAAGSNGTSATAIIASAGKAYTDYISTTDTIDVLLASSDATKGVLRVFAVVVDMTSRKPAVQATEVDRDQLA
jgi:hypothetical protein